MSEGCIRLFPSELVIQPQLSGRWKSVRIVQRDGRDIDGAGLAVAFVGKLATAGTAERALHAG